MQGKTRLGIFYELVSSSYVELSQPLDGHLIRVNTVDVDGVPILMSIKILKWLGAIIAVARSASRAVRANWISGAVSFDRLTSGAELAAEGAHMQCHAGSTCSDATCRVVQDPAESCDALAFAVSSRGHVPEPLDAADSALAQLAQTVQISGSCSSMARWLSPVFVRGEQRKSSEMAYQAWVRIGFGRGF